MKKHFDRTELSRREFISASAAAAIAGTALSHSKVRAQEGGTLRVGLVGCGGRGTGAAAQALNADQDVKLVAMGDAFADRLETSLKTLRAQDDVAKKIDLSPEQCFVGFDAYEKVIQGVDVVLLATPPHFRPIHIKAAIQAGKHVFAEKPCAVDAAGVRSVLESCEEARRKKLAVLSGLCLRFSAGYREMVKRIHAGEIGEIRALQANDYRGPIWVKPRQPGWTDMEYHMRNWYYFTWLSGDFNVEQHVHMLDLCAWVMRDGYPINAVGTGGRQARTGPDYGNIYDHHAVIYEYPNQVKLFATCRQQQGTANDISATIYGTKGVAYFSSRGSYIETDQKEMFRGERDNIYQIEHDEFFASIRRNEPMNNGEYMSKSTLMTVLGRMATYTGQKVTWKQAMDSQEELSPASYDWNARPPVSEIAIPGTTKLV
jgi:predicted dehydrogenase